MEALNRRNFVQRGSRLALASGALLLPAGFPGTTVSQEQLFIHHVFFWLKNPEDPEKAKRFESALKDLVKIDAIQQYHLGKPADTRRDVIDSGYHYSLLTLFQDKAAHDAYQVHPVHDAFRIVAGELCSKVLVYDSVPLG